MLIHPAKAKVDELFYLKMRKSRKKGTFVQFLNKINTIVKSLTPKIVMIITVFINFGHSFT